MLIQRIDSLELFFTKSNGWSIRKGDHTYELDKELINQPFIYWLPLLENDPIKLVRNIDVNLKEQGFPDNFLSSFPVVDLIKIALISSSIHWTKAALKWIEQLNLEYDFTNELEELIKSPLLKKKQSLKHRIYRIINIRKRKDAAPR